ncbi:hypothetical protein HY489_04340 [Candidatus Woesearchaeota archaeon]|nr:hypothetical protein [Candidatus Woesearchaeota archaeon]
MHHGRMAEILLETGAYRDLETPTILTSGELGIYYINTEKILPDNGTWEKCGDDPRSMQAHVLSWLDMTGPYKEAIDLLAQKASSLMQQDRACAISGGQRRDWLFSMPVAHRLGKPHLALFKPEKGKPDRIEIQGTASSTSGLYVVHIADLLTEASSCYRQEEDQELGWVPMIRRAGATINDLVTVVSRLQGGEQRLASAGVNTHSFVDIGPEFLCTYSDQGETAIKYHRSPREFAEGYLRLDGPLAFVKFFDPKGGKLDRATKFLQRYGGFLKSVGRYEELETAVQKAYGTPLPKAS